MGAVSLGLQILCLSAFYFAGSGPLQALFLLSLRGEGWGPHEFSPFSVIFPSPRLP